MIAFINTQIWKKTVNRKIMQDDLLKKIADSIGVLNLSESKVAALICAEPEIVAQCGMARIAALAEVSEPTVLRFCRSLGFGGFGEFKKEFVHYLSDGGLEKFIQINSEDSVDDIIIKEQLKIQKNVKSFFGELKRNQLEEVAKRLNRSSFVLIFAERVLVPVAMYAQNKLLQLGKHASVFQDYRHLLEVAGILPEKDSLVLLISEKDSEKVLINIAQIVTQKRLTSVCVTRPYAELAAECDYTLYFPETMSSSGISYDDYNFFGMSLVNILSSMLQRDEDNYS